jgi:predicted nucleic acid-binding protein
MKVVFDTNVFVSAFLFPGSQGEEALLLAHRRKVLLYSSVPILTETARVFRTKFDQIGRGHYRRVEDDRSNGNHRAPVASGDSAGGCAG